MAACPFPTQLRWIARCVGEILLGSEIKFRFLDRGMTQRDLNPRQSCPALACQLGIAADRAALAMTIMLKSFDLHS